MRMMPLNHLGQLHLITNENDILSAKPGCNHICKTHLASFIDKQVIEFPVELRKVVYTTNAIESLNARFRRAVRHRGHFPNEQAALKVLYLVATQKRKNRSNMSGKTNGWKSILNTLTIHYGDRIAANSIN